MHAFASYILRGPTQAILVTTTSFTLSLLLPPLSYFSGAAVGLVTLRQGRIPGALVMIGAVSITALLSFSFLEYPAITLVFAAIVWLPVWLLALVLRQTTSLQKTLTAAAILGSLYVLAIHLFVNDPTSWWHKDVLIPLFTPLLNQSVLDPAQRDSLQNTLEIIAQYMTGITAAAIVLSTLSSLFLARWWQSILFNPSGFRTEFLELRLGKKLTVATLIILGLAIVPLGGISNIAANIVMVLLTLYVLQGLSLVHIATAKFGAHKAWLITIYMLLFFLPQVMLLLALAGFIDTWVNLRAYLPGKRQD